MILVIKVTFLYVENCKGKKLRYKMCLLVASSTKLVATNLNLFFNKDHRKPHQHYSLFAQNDESDVS